MIDAEAIRRSLFVVYYFACGAAFGALVTKILLRR